MLKLTYKLIKYVSYFNKWCYHFFIPNNVKQMEMFWFMTSFVCATLTHKSFVFSMEILSSLMYNVKQMPLSTLKENFQILD